MTTLQTINASASPEVQMNENFDAISPSGLFGRKGPTTTGLVWGYYGGILYVDGVATTIADGTTTLAASQTNYVEATRAGVVSDNIVGFTAGQIPLYTVVTGASTITSYIDQRSWREKFTRSTLTKSIAGGAGDTVLTAAEARVEHIKLTGVLTGNRTVTVPNVPWSWIIDNQTTGAFTVTVRTAAGAGVVVGQSSAAVLYCDAVDVKSAITGAGGDFAVGGNLTVTGDFTVNGTTVTVNTSTLDVEDPLIALARGNVVDTLDIGFYGLYQPAATPLYAGLFRDATDGKFKLFHALQNVPTTTVNVAGTGYAAATLVVGPLEATTGTFSGALSTTLTTDATSISTGASLNSGGASITKALWVGGLANIAGAVTLQSTLAVTGTVTSTGTQTLFTRTGASTDYHRFVIANTTGRIQFGVEDSAGGSNITGSAAYASFITSVGATKLELGSNQVLAISMNGNAVTIPGTLGLSGVLTTTQTVNINVAGNSYDLLNIKDTADQSGVSFIQFKKASGTAIGSISRVTTTDAVAYNTTSDYRTKDIDGPYDQAASVLSTHKVYLGNYKNGGVKRPLLLAHEAASWAVSGVKDAVDEEGRPVYQSIDYATYTPLLIAGWQNHEARLAALETK